MLISHAHFPILSSPTHHHLHAWGVFISFFFIITLNLTTITLRPVKRENQLNSHFLLHRLPFLCFFLLACCLFIILLVGLLVGWMAGLFDCITFFLDVCTFGSATATIRSGSLTFNRSPHSMESTLRREKRNTTKEKKRATSQGCNKTSIVVQSLHCYRLNDGNSVSSFFWLI